MKRPRVFPGAVSFSARLGTASHINLLHFHADVTVVFAGEASWRWRMMLPSSNKTYETFWRQAGRWLAAPTPDPVALTVPSLPVGGRGALTLDVRDTAFRPVSDGTVRVARHRSPPARCASCRPCPTVRWPAASWRPCPRSRSVWYASMRRRVEGRDCWGRPASGRSSAGWIAR